MSEWMNEWMSEWMNELYFYFNTVKNISLHRKLIKNSQKLFYIFAVWEYWPENHLLELLLKKPKELDVRISSGKLFLRIAPL